VSALLRAPPSFRSDFHESSCIFEAKTPSPFSTVVVRVTRSLGAQRRSRNDKVDRSIRSMGITFFVSPVSNARLIFGRAHQHPPVQSHILASRVCWLHHRPSLVYHGQIKGATTQQRALRGELNSITRIDARCLKIDLAITVRDLRSAALRP